MKQNRSFMWRPWCIIQKKGLHNITCIILALLLFTLYPSRPVHAIGPYAVDRNTVIDQSTGLVWQKADDSILRSWPEALAYCENLSLDSKTDWRLPDVRELNSIVDDSKYLPAIDPAFNCQSSYYWTATTSTVGTAYAWDVNFHNGYSYWGHKTLNYYVRCVSKQSTNAPDEPIVLAQEPLDSEPIDVMDGRTSRPMVPLYFDYDASTIRPNQVARMDRNASFLKSKPVKINIEGNCDPRGTQEYNIALGERRALSAQKYLVDKGVAKENMSTISYGEEKILLQGQDELSWAQNRRVDFVLVK